MLYHETKDIVYVMLFRKRIGEHADLSKI